MLITLVVPARPLIELDGFNMWPCSLSTVTVTPAGIVSLKNQLPPDPVVALVAVAILHKVTSTLDVLVFVRVNLPINFLSLVLVEINVVAAVVN